MLEMQDILEKQKKQEPVASNSTLAWYLEDMLLSYKYNFEERFFRDLSALRNYLERQVYLILKEIGENHYWKKGGS